MSRNTFGRNPYVVALEDALMSRYRLDDEEIEDFKTDQRGCYFDLGEEKVWMSSSEIWSLMYEAVEAYANG